MIEITFMFRTPHIERSYGKIKLRYYSDDHDGLNNEIRPYVTKALKSLQRTETQNVENTENTENTENMFLPKRFA